MATILEELKNMSIDAKRSQESKKAFVNTGGIDIIDGYGNVLD